MRRSLLVLAVFGTGLPWTCAQESGLPGTPVGMPGIMYSGVIAGGTGEQLYPFDRQDPWLHGYFQRIPAWGGYSSFRPYNYRHVLSQRQIATSVWGADPGHPYSQQFWNRYRADYLNGNLHYRGAARTVDSGVNPVSFQTQQAVSPTVPPKSPPAAERPIHIYPAGTPVRGN